jgi:hypothetical protein
MPSPLPRQNHRLHYAHFACAIGLPRSHDGSASALLFSRPAQRSLPLWPTCSPNPLRTLYTRGFSRFVTSTTALIATGWSESCRAGFAPAEKQRLCTAHTSIQLSFPKIHSFRYKALRQLIRQVYRMRDETFKYLTAVLTFLQGCQDKRY